MSVEGEMMKNERCEGAAKLCSKIAKSLKSLLRSSAAKGAANAAKGVLSH